MPKNNLSLQKIKKETESNARKVWCSSGELQKIKKEREKSDVNFLSGRPRSIHLSQYAATKLVAARERSTWMWNVKPKGSERSRDATNLHQLYFCNIIFFSDYCEIFRIRPKNTEGGVTVLAS